MKTTRRSLATLGLGATLLIAACGGGPGATTGPAGPGATVPGAPASSAPAATSGPSQAHGGPAATQAGSGGRGSPAPGVTDQACTMLSAADIQAVVNATLVNAVPAQQLGLFTNGCLFELRDTATSATTTINLGAVATGGRTYWDSELVPTMAQNGFAPLDGLGDAAVGGRGGGVMAVSGDSVVYVQYFGPTGPDQAVAQEVARRILSNLGH